MKKFTDLDTRQARLEQSSIPNSSQTDWRQRTDSELRLITTTITTSLIPNLLGTGENSILAARKPILALMLKKRNE